MAVTFASRVILRQKCGISRLTHMIQVVSQQSHQ